MLNRKATVVMAAALCASLMLASAVSSLANRTFLPFMGRNTDMTPPPLKIAVLSDLSGPAAEMGGHTRDGVVLAFEEWNAAGGVLGREVEWVVGDSQCDATAGLQAAQQAVEQDQVRYIVGAFCSRASAPISDYANQNGVLQISPASSWAEVTVGASGVKPYVFRANWEESFQGRVMAAFALTNLGADTAAVLGPGEGIYEPAFRDEFEAGGGEIVASETVEVDQTDFSAELSAIATASPDVLFVPVPAMQASQIASQAQPMGITATMLGMDIWESADLDRQALEGAYFPVPYTLQDPRPEVLAFRTRYSDRYGTDPGGVAALGYDAATMLLQSIETAAVDNPAVVKDAMAVEQFDVVTGRIAFDEFHNPIKNAAIMTIQSGQDVFVTSIRPD